MFTQEELLKLIQNGSTPESLADSFTESLNAAIKENDRLKEEEKAKIEAEKSKNLTKKIKIVNDILGLTADLLQFYPEIYDAEQFKKLDPQEIVEILDSTYEEVINLPKDFLSLFNIPKEEKADPIADFLKEFKLS